MKTIMRNLKVVNQSLLFRNFQKISQNSFSYSFNKNPAECYYKTLNNSPSSSIDEIKKEYYKLAKKFHPDNNKSNSKENQAVN